MTCDCEKAGWCERRQRFMSTRLHTLCQQGRKIPVVQADPLKIVAPEDIPCVHRGTVTRQDRCRMQQCQGGPVFDVFACGIKGECSIQNRAVPGLAVCKTCRERCDVYNGPVRVVFLSPGMLRGGAERWIITLCKSWKTDVKATAVVLADWGGSEPDLVDELTRAGVTVYGGQKIPATESHSKVKRLDTVVDAVRRALRSADTVISWGWGDAHEVLRHAGWTGPHIVVSHGACDWSQRLLDGPSCAATHLAAVSEAAALSFPEDQRDQTRIMWNGIELDRIAPSRPRDEVRDLWGCGRDDLLIGYVGRLAVSKRPESVAMAAVELQRRWPDRIVRPILVGDGTHRDIVINECRKLVGDALVIVSPPDHIGDAYAALDVMVLASPSEGMSLALCEAWAAGVPTVATPVGAVPEIERKFGELTYCVSVKSKAGELADAVEAALSGSRHVVAQQVALREMTAARMARRWADWLVEILAG